MINSQISCSQIDWAAVSAIASVALVLVSVFLLYPQLKRIKQESTSDMVAGLQTALKLMDNSGPLKLVIEATSTGRNRPSDDVNQWKQVFEVLNQIALLIEKKYTDEELFMSLKARDLTALGRYLQKNTGPESRPEGPGLYLGQRYALAKGLLESAIRWETEATKQQTARA
jgi:hypothetical protein